MHIYMYISFLALLQLSSLAVLHQSVQGCSPRVSRLSDENWLLQTLQVEVKRGLARVQRIAGKSDKQSTNVIICRCVLCVCV